MEKNKSLLGKRETKDNTIDNRNAFIEKWKTEMNNIYTRPENPPRVPEFDYIEDVDLDELEATSMSIPVTVEGIGEAFKGKSLRSCPGMNAIGYEMLRYSFIADPL